MSQPARPVMPQLQVSYHGADCITPEGICFTDAQLRQYADTPNNAHGTTYVMPNRLSMRPDENHLFFRRASAVPEGIIDTIKTFITVSDDTFRVTRDDVAAFFAEASGFFVTYFTHGISVTRLMGSGGPCLKQNVYATVVSPDGEQFTGTNLCKNPQTVCPREVQGVKSGEGYHLCEEVCQQTGHAEVNALAKAKDKAKGGILYLSGHLYACGGCTAAIQEAGIVELRMFNHKL